MALIKFKRAHQPQPLDQILRISHTSEFYALTAIGTVKPLQALARSQQKDAKKVAERMLKTTAILLTIGGASGSNASAYQHYFKPTLTAMGR